MKSNVLREALDEQSLIEIKIKIVTNRCQESHMRDRLSEENGHSVLLKVNLRRD